MPFDNTLAFKMYMTFVLKQKKNFRPRDRGTIGSQDNNAVLCGH